MGLISWIGKGLKSFFTPESFKTGERFENYVRKRLFTERYFELLQRTYGYNVRTGNYVDSSNPDFKLRDRKTLKTFYVEIKFRKYFYQGKTAWCTENQLNHYRRCNHEAPVFVLLGVGGLPHRPKLVFLIPLRVANFTELYISEIKKYMIHPRKPVLSRTLWRR
ncbi:MAG: hypothetical protein IT214_10035 [Chitinophagaceae bacterium]|jgi:hypothetical protein|nr:hypothetical protein [Chitinophagaceae bacterium]OQY94521.1 MAG: hypothetical protein B6D37_08260 [Sphingobacteriales bacterium UTBCD1]